MLINLPKDLHFLSKLRERLLDLFIASFHVSDMFSVRAQRFIMLDPSTANNFDMAVSYYISYNLPHLFGRLFVIIFQVTYLIPCESLLPIVSEFCEHILEYASHLSLVISLVSLYPTGVCMWMWHEVDVDLINVSWISRILIIVLGWFHSLLKLLSLDGGVGH
jgi:hypothetical protein